MKADMSLELIRTEILNNKQCFMYKANSLSKIVDLDKKKKAAYELISYALNVSTSYYSSDTVEGVFLQIAKDTHLLANLSTNFSYNSVLHIMTQSYQSGGHTRIVERWIENSDYGQTHSLLFTSAENHEVPERLILSVINKSGKIIKLSDQLSDLDKGLELRKIASQYEFIILHTHPEDVVPLIAFGNEEFNRPIAFFNHADHKFWVGGSISDIIVNFRTWGEKININNRGLDNNFILTLPIENSSCIQRNKIDMRNQLRLSQESKIVVTIGAPHKLKPIASGDNFLNIVTTLLESVPDLIFIIIGSFLKELPGWEKESKKYNHRIIALGHLNPNDMFKYLNASDLVIDSYPMSGGTALIDAASCMKPILSMNCPTGQLDYVFNSDAYCDTWSELLIKAKEILFDENVAQKNINNVQHAINKAMGFNIWKDELNKLYNHLRKCKHTINYFTSRSSGEITNNDIYLYSEYKMIKYKLNIPRLFSFYTLVKNGKKYREILLFNKVAIRITEKQIY